MIGARLAPLGLGTAAVVAGAAFLWVVGAIPGMASRNLASFLVGLGLGWLLHRVARWRHGAIAIFLVTCGLLALVVAIGTEIDGVKRWLPIGPVHVQPALILAPLLLALVASREGRHWRAIALVPLGLIAAQPDAATTIAFAGGVVILMVSVSAHARKGWSVRRVAVAAASVALTAIALLWYGIATPPPVAFVEGTAGIAATSGATAILLHLAALGLMVSALAMRGDDAGLALAAYFMLAAIAASFFAFPMPVAGAGPSHLIGFGIAIGWLTQGSRRADSSQAAAPSSATALAE